MFLVDNSTDSPRLIIGHNVSYDRQRCAEQYELMPSKTRFMDTMSLHIAVSGMTSGQRMVKAMYNKETEGESTSDDNSFKPQWVEETAMNNLNDVYQLYCPGSEPLKKAKRDVFVTGSSEDVREDLQSLMTYCGYDVLASGQVFTEIFPLFRQRCPHPATLAGMLDMALGYLPTNSNWDHYVKQSDNAFEELEEETAKVLSQQAKESCQLLNDDLYKTDLWMWDQDWSTKEMKFRKIVPKSTKNEKNEVVISKKKSSNPYDFETLHEHFKPLLKSKSDLYKVQPAIPGYPTWYTELCVKSKKNEFIEPQGLTAGKKVVPKLLRLTWMGYPLHRHETEKWGYLKLNEHVSTVDEQFDIDDTESIKFSRSALKNFLEETNIIEKSSKDREELDLQYTSPMGYPPDAKRKKKVKPEKPVPEEGIKLPETPGCTFMHLPHKDGKGNNVGNPMSKDFLDKIRDGILATKSGQLAEKVLLSAKSISYWRSSQERIRNQMIVKLGPSHNNNELKDVSAIIPMIVPAGTLTRRAVERTWLTASNAKKDRIGSELKSIIQAPPGYSFVGADVDSQELWIAAVIGDSQFTGHHGSTALGWMTLQGTKSKGTDMHSVVAKSVDITRDRAKILNYGRIYGAGTPFAKQLLMQFNPLLTEDNAGRLASKMYVETKGERRYVLNKFGAFCYSLSYMLSSEASKTGFSEFEGIVLSRKEMSALVGIKRKLDMYVEFTEMPTENPLSFKLNDHAEMLADEMDLQYEKISQGTPSEKLNFIRKFLNIVGYSAKRKTDEEERQSYIAATKIMSKKTVWFGGSESHTFNRLEQIASQRKAVTPILGCHISRVLDSSKVGDAYLPSRINWVVQSSAVDYLHLLLVAMRWLMSKECYDINGRFLISIHDEVRYMVPYEERYKAALALQTANLLVRAMFCSRLGMSGLPKSVAFFSSVDIDQVMRKEPEMECVTPSNPQGLKHGYGIDAGESMTIQQTLDILRTSNKL